MLKPFLDNLNDFYMQAYLHKNANQLSLKIILIEKVCKSCEPLRSLFLSFLYGFEYDLFIGFPLAISQSLEYGCKCYI